jgi:hypothetical protein
MAGLLIASPHSVAYPIDDFDRPNVRGLIILITLR